MSNAADETKVEDQRQSADFQAREARLDLMQVLSTPRGRRFVWRVLAIARTYEQSFTGDPLTTAFNEGRRAVGNQILAELNETAPDAFVLMLREQQRAAREVEQTSDARQEAETDG
jgi:hypothetical protein